MIEVSGSYGLGVSVSGQAGSAEGRAGAGTEIEGTIGLGGGNAEVTVFAGAQASAKTGGLDGEVKAGLTASSKDGVGLSAEVRGTAGSVGGSVRADRNGIRAGPMGQTAKDSKLGGHFHVGIGFGISVNLSQAKRAYQNAAKSVAALGRYLIQRVLPNGLPKGQGGSDP